MIKKSVIFVSLVFVLTGFAFAQEVEEPEELECEILESEDGEVEVDGDRINLAQGMQVSGDDTVHTENGSIVAVCNDGFRQVSEDSEGQFFDVAERTDEFETELPEPQNQSIAQALNQTDEIEENLEEVNQVIDETVPDRIASIILGDNVNFQVDDVRIGIGTNETGVTGVEEDGFEDPDLSINMDEDTIETIMTSENTTEEFREAFHGEGIEVEAYSIGNRITLGVVSTASRVYGFVSDLI